jgi:hypothetical protein
VGRRGVAVGLMSGVECVRRGVNWMGLRQDGGLGCELRGRVSRLSSAGVSRLDGEQEVAWHLHVRIAERELETQETSIRGLGVLFLDHLALGI